MNKQQKELLLEELGGIEEDIKRNNIRKIMGVVLIIIGSYNVLGINIFSYIGFGYIGSGIILFSLVSGGIISVIWSSVANSSNYNRRNDINYKLAGKGVKNIDVYRNIEKYFCNHCDSEVNQNAMECKKCGKFLTSKGAIKIKEVKEKY